MFYIYKITNLINNKIYIGQVYIKTIYDRFNRHIKDASSQSRSYIDRAINKYGKDNFVVELIEECKNCNELNNKEKYCISFFNSTNHDIGYNLTDGGGGNTYKYKTNEELNVIKDKISKANKGKNNGNSVQIKMLNIETNNIIHFDTLNEILLYFNIKNKSMIKDICNNNAKYYFRNKYIFAYENEEFNRDLLIRTKHNWRDNKNVPKCVSTIPDECKGVGPEMNTGSKQQAMLKYNIEDIVRTVERSD